jgi:hypothetical protein
LSNMTSLLVDLASASLLDIVNPPTTSSGFGRSGPSAGLLPRSWRYGAGAGSGPPCAGVGAGSPDGGTGPGTGAGKMIGLGAGVMIVVVVCGATEDRVLAK